MFEWFACGCPLGNVATAQAEMRQLCAHLAIRAISQPGSWLFCAMCTPQRLAEVLLPTMPDSEFATLMQASGHVGWYKCKNGHPYSVGNCTWPMEEARCPVPGCGARIGGSNHVAVAGEARNGSLGLEHRARSACGEDAIVHGFVLLVLATL